MTTTTAYVLDLRDAIDYRAAGRKAATLARLRRDGFPVPDGVVLIADALDHALAEAGLPADVSAEAVAAIDVPAEIAAGLREAVRRWPGTPLAVRSSGTEEDLASASYAGLYTTVLDVTGEDRLLDAVRQCWASAFGELVRSYRTEPEGGAARMAVLVQPMVSVRAAGVAFTADPVTGDRGAVVVEAVRGLGEPLVSGAVSPEKWVVRGGAVSRRTTGPEDAIDAEVARAIAELARQLEQHQQSGPQDIEWALSGGEVVLLQARPATALPEPPIEPVPLPIDPPPGYWTREASHAPLPWTPFNRVVARSRTPAARSICEELGFLFETIDFSDIGGWEYMRVVPLGGKDRPAPPARLMPLVFRLVPSLRRRVKACVAALQADVPGRLVRRWYEEWQGEFDRRIADLREVDLTGMADSELDAHLTGVLGLFDHGMRVHMRLHGAVGITLAELAFACRRLLGWDDARTFDLLAGLSEKSTEPSRALARLAALANERPAVKRRLIERAPVEVVLAQDEQFTAAFAGFLRTHGCRALRYETAERNLDERPDLVLALIADQLAAGFDPARTAAALASRRDRAAAEAGSRLTSPEDRDRFDRALARAAAAYPVREDNEYFTLSAPLALVRRAALEVGRRLADRGQIELRDDVFHLEAEEARAALRDGAERDHLVTRAKGERAWTLAHPGPASYGKDPGPPPPFGSLPAEARLVNEGFLWAIERIFGPDTAGRAGADGAVTGVPASAGSYTGRVRVIRNEAEFGRLRAGDVLVCPVTSPVWSVLFPSVGALVTDTGGTLSHPAIIAREYGVPAVVATGNGTSALRDGQLVTVDGTAGIVGIVP
jgi:phosphohistidine swiveling domain-containing protein